LGKTVIEKESDTRDPEESHYRYFEPAKERQRLAKEFPGASGKQLLESCGMEQSYEP
jgi:hypothetical protein